MILNAAFAMIFFIGKNKEEESYIKVLASTYILDFGEISLGMDEPYMNAIE